MISDDIFMIFVAFYLFFLPRDLVASECSVRTVFKTINEMIGPNTGLVFGLCSAVLAEWRSRDAPRRLRRSTAAAWENRWWSMLAVAAQDSLAATLVDDAPHLLHGWRPEEPPLGVLLHGEAPSQSRLPLR